MSLVVLCLRLFIVEPESWRDLHINVPEDSNSRFITIMHQARKAVHCKATPFTLWRVCVSPVILPGHCRQWSDLLADVECCHFQRPYTWVCRCYSYSAVRTLSYLIQFHLRRLEVLQGCGLDALRGCIRGTSCGDPNTASCMLVRIRFA